MCPYDVLVAIQPRRRDFDHERWGRHIRRAEKVHTDWENGALTAGSGGTSIVVQPGPPPTTPDA